MVFASRLSVDDTSSKKDFEIFSNCFCSQIWFVGHIFVVYRACVGYTKYVMSHMCKGGIYSRVMVLCGFSIKGNTLYSNDVDFVDFC